MAASNPAGCEWLSPLRMSDIDFDGGTDDEMDGKPPVHPVPTMQGAFEESMKETLEDNDEPDPSDRYSTADSISRRKMLLEQEEYERTVAGRWKQKPGEKFHPLWKLVAQISFGMHLLQQGLAKSDEEVIKILQTHVDEVDGFLERTTEDFDLAQGDINERIRYLRLPLEHGEVFDGMLNDRNFRIAIVEGNEKIEHIIDRTAAAMNDALKDVQKGLDATRELAKYLTKVDKKWDDRSEEHNSVYLAMIGNTEGWTRAFLTLQSKGSTLRKALVQLQGIVAEMQKRAGAASRKNLVPVKSINGRYYVEIPSTSIHHSQTPPRSPHKPLPEAPNPTVPPLSIQKPPNLRVRTSGKSSKRKEPSSPYIEQAMAAKRMEPVMRVTSSERSISVKSPDSTPSLRGIEPVQPTKGAETAPATRGIDSTPSAKEVEPVPSPNEVGFTPVPEGAEAVRSPKSAELRTSTKGMGLNPPDKPVDPTPAASVAQPAPPIPARSLSRRTSMSDRRRSMTRKLSFFKDNGNDRNSSSTNLIVHAPHQEQTPKTQNTSLLRRLSSRKRAAMSVSVYSSSPSTPTRRKESPVPREASPPVVSPSGEPVPPQSTYGSISFLPMHPLISPMQDTFPSDLEPSSHSHSRSHSRSQSYHKVIVPLSENHTEGSDSTTHPLFRNSRQNLDRSTNLSQPFLTTSGNEKNNASNVSRPSVDDMNNTNVSTYSTHPLLVTAPEVPDSKGKPFLPPLDTVGQSAKGSASNSALLQNQSRNPEDVDDLADVIRTHSLVVAAMNKSENDLNNLRLANPPARTELKEPASPSHPLLLEGRHMKFASKLPSLAPPRYPSRDLPLRHYRSQEILYSKGLSLSRQDDTKSSHKRSSSLYQRGTTHLSSSVGSPPLPTTLSPAPAHSSATPSPLHIVSLPPTASLQPRDSNTASSFPVGPNSSTKISGVGGDATPSPIKLRRPLTLETNPSLYTTPAETKAVTPIELQGPAPADLDTTPITAKNCEIYTPPANPSPSTKYKTSATNNVPFYLNPASSAALLEFLASTPPPSPPNPDKSQTLPLKPVTSPTGQRDYLSEPLSAPTLAAPPPPPSGPIPRPLPVTFSPDGPKVIPIPSITEKKISGWKKVFRVGSGSGSALAKKNPKPAKGGVLVIGEPQPIVAADKKSKPKAKKGSERWEAPSRRSGHHRKSHSGGAQSKSTGNVNGNSDGADSRNRTEDREANGAKMKEAEGGFMGVGKDGVWISRKNFLKT